MRQPICILFVLAMCLAVASNAEARSKRDTTYRYDSLWSTSVRFLRVDNRFPITEKAKKEGYILFEYREEQKKYAGALELIPTVSGGRHQVRISVRIANMPGYVEKVFLNQLMRKMRKEHGDPPPAQKVKPPSKKDGDDSETDDESSGDDSSDESAQKEEAQKEK